MKRLYLVSVAPLLLLALGGCMQRRMVVTSNPPGALVRINDVEIGHTPAQATFQYYGVYDVRVSLDGYEPIATSRRAEQPWYAHAPFDIGASAFNVKNTVTWHFDLEPALEHRVGTEEVEQELMKRATGLRDQLQGDS